MDSHAKLAWFAVTCLGLIALAHSVPLQVLYTGEGCDCPSKLGYLVNVPKVPKSKTYLPAAYGYKVDVPAPAPLPVQAKAKVSYTFDFTVEEPRQPKPVQPAPKWNLYAKVDRVAVNKGDCADNYAAPSAPAPCQCAQCAISQPPYRYVYKKVAPCKCQRPNCKCNSGRSYAYSPNAIASTRVLRPAAVVLPQPLDPAEPLEATGAGSNIRRKRDLHRAFFRPRQSPKERPGRFVKLYHKNLPESKQALFGLDGLVNSNSTPKKSKRKAKKALFTHQRSRLVKRDIKGEYELLEKEREQMDLTLPEIIQFMPETLQPDFKRGQCYFGCSTQRNAPQPPQQSSNEFSSSKETSGVSAAAFSSDFHNYSDNNSNRNNNDNNNANIEEIRAENVDEPRPPKQPQSQRFLKETNASPKNVVSTSYTKRNAANYNYDAAIAPPVYGKRPPFASIKKRAYRAQSPAHISTNPLYGNAASSLTPSPGSAYSARLPQQPASTPPRYVYDHMGRKYLESNGRLSLTVTSTRIADPMDRNGAPLQYAGDLEAPPAGYSELLNDDSILRAPNYPVQHISNEQLDRIISEIIYRHPEFIDASSHYHGALVDPEPWQEQETKEFLKKLIDGRLNLWFGDQDDYIPHYSSTYSNPYNEYNAPPMYSYLPPLL